MIFKTHSAHRDRCVLVMHASISMSGVYRSL
uniref:Uncharacterized protein n=1 Tax=viral metagenome TaxID=1070528 RepID=A0A6C0M0R8_9ZZZZ